MVLTSYKQETAISNIIIKKIVTRRPDNIEGVILRNSWLFVFVVYWVCSRSLELWVIGLLAKNIIDYGFYLRTLVNCSGDICYKLLR